MTRRVPRAVLALTAVAVVSMCMLTTAGHPAGAAPRPGTTRLQGGPTITGGGSSFANLQMSAWRADINRNPYNLNVNYSAAGSSFGREQFKLGLIDFGASDIEYQAPELPSLLASPRANFVYVPVLAGAVGFMFNLRVAGQRIGNLNLTPNDVCRIFTEPGMTWNDPAIVASNPGVPLPASTIRPVIRADGSGTSYVLSEYCIATAPDVWRGFIGRVISQNVAADDQFKSGRPTSSWPPLGGFATAFAEDGVANLVADANQGVDTITYLASGYARNLGMPTALVRNAAGHFVPPNPANSTIALGYATPQPNGTFQLQYNGPDPRAYFPSTYSYVLAQTSGFDPAKGRVLATFLNYAVTKGQERAEPLLYSRLSTVLVNLSLDKIVQIPGAPPRPTDLAGAPPPPQVLNGPGGIGGGGSGGPGSGAGGPAAGGPGANGAADPAATTTVPGAAAQTEQGYSLELSEDEAAALADDVKDTLGAKRLSAGRDLGEVVVYLLIGFVLVGAGSFAARGVRGSWQR